MNGYPVEAIAWELREAEVEVSRGMTVMQVSKKPVAKRAPDIAILKESTSGN